MKSDRSNKPRGRAGVPPARSGPRKPPRTFGESPPRRSAPPRDRGDAADPYQPARRPGGFVRDKGEDRFARGARNRPPGDERAGFSARGTRGFTVTLDPDVARVFRGDASVNRALRLVLQLMQVVQGPPAPRREGAPRGYQGTPEARGFTRRPRFEDDDAIDSHGTE